MCPLDQKLTVNFTWDYCLFFYCDQLHLKTHVCARKKACLLVTSFVVGRRNISFVTGPEVLVAMATEG